jgi:outer membrane protein assembly factor BamA
MLSYISYQEKGLESKSVDYSILEYDLRFYKTISEDFFAKVRFSGRNSFRDVPFYDQSFLGYDYLVRGESDNEREDYNVFLYSLEISYPIIKSWNLSLDLPLIPKKLTSARIDLYLSSFFDAGTTFGKNKIISTDGYYYGYGLGLTILVLPYNAIRMEFALNKKGVGEFLFGTGFSF